MLALQYLVGGNFNHHFLDPLLHLPLLQPQLLYLCPQLPIFFFQVPQSLLGLEPQQIELLLLGTAQFPQSDALCEQLHIVLLEFLLSGRAGRGRLPVQLFEDVDLRGDGLG